MKFYTFDIAENEYLVIEADSITSAIEELYCITNIDYEELYAISYEENSEPCINKQPVKKYAKHKQLSKVDDMTSNDEVPEIQIYYASGLVEYYYRHATEI